jgi:hypothetical protein
MSFFKHPNDPYNSICYNSLGVFWTTFTFAYSPNLRLGRDIRMETGNSHPSDRNLLAHSTEHPKTISPSRLHRAFSLRRLRPPPANRYHRPMESTPLSARRTEDIALDLLKFVAGHANLGRPSAASTGFGLPSAAKSDDQVTHLLELYSRCRLAVEAPASATPSK